MVQGEFLRSRAVGGCKASSLEADVVHDEQATSQPARASTLELL